MFPSLRDLFRKPSIAEATKSEPPQGREAAPVAPADDTAKPFRLLGYPMRALSVLLMMLGLVYLPQLAPSLPLSTLQPAQWISAFDLLEGRTFDFGIVTDDPHASLDSLLAREREHPLLDPSGSLDPFFRALQQTENARISRPKPDGAAAVTGPVHVLHYGDSPTTADLITADVRTRMQERFGDAGHGFSLIAPPWAWYKHHGVKLSASGWAMASPTLSRANDGMYGLGGVSFEGSQGAHSEIALQDAGHNRVQVYYLKRPNGGTFSLEADGASLGEIDTAAEGVESSSRTLVLPAGAKRVSLRVDRGSVRVFGLELFKNKPGVVYSSLGLNGGSTEVLSRHIAAAHWAQQLREAKPSLVIINYGTNESVYKEYVSKQLEKELRQAITRVREAVPDAGILVMSPMDRGVRDEAGNITTAATIPQVVEIQQRVALDMKVAFFNTFQAMGGSGTMAKWYISNPRLVGGDYIHPMPAGAKLVGDKLFEGIEEQYRMFKLRELRKSLAESTPAQGKRG